LRAGLQIWLCKEDIRAAGGAQEQGRLGLELATPAGDQREQLGISVGAVVASVNPCSPVVMRDGQTSISRSSWSPQSVG